MKLFFEYFYFSADFRMKMLIWISLDYRKKKWILPTKRRSNDLFYYDFDDIKVIYEVDRKAIQSDT